jgi:hypothetical protein
MHATEFPWYLSFVSSLRTPSKRYKMFFMQFIYFFCDSCLNRIAGFLRSTLKSIFIISVVHILLFTEALILSLYENLLGLLVPSMLYCIINRRYLKFDCLKATLITSQTVNHSWRQSSNLYYQILGRFTPLYVAVVEEAPVYHL